MGRRSVDQYDTDGRLFAGYDYINQAWVLDGVYVKCGHPPGMDCSCYGTLHAGEQPPIGNRAINPGYMKQHLLKSWLLYGEGMLDAKQSRCLFLWTKEEINRA